jgi:hypothetical protein
LGTNLDLCRRRWHPAKTPGVLRIASAVLHILPQTAVAPDSGAPAALVIGRKAAQERFSEESFRTLLRPLNSTSPETHFSTALPQAPAQLCGNSRHTASLDELAEPNNYSNWDETSSTHLFASHCRNRSGPARPALRQCLENVSLDRLAESVSSLYTTSFPFH